VTRMGAVCCVCVVALATLYTYCFWPGVYSWDSFEAWRQGYTGTITNWQSPLHSFMLGWPTRYGVPLSFAFAVQALAFTVLLLALTLSTSSRVFQVGVVVFIAVPPMLVMFSTMWRDSMAIVCLLAWLLSMRRRRLAFGLMALLGTILFRWNAVVMLPPLIWLLLPGESGIRRRLYRSVFFAVLLAILPSIMHRIAGVKDAWPLGSSRLYELNAMTTRRPLPPKQNFLSGYITAKQQRQMSGGCGVWALVNGGVEAFEAPRLVENRDAINNSWWRAVRTSPVNWLLVRTEMARCILRYGYAAPDRPFRKTTDGHNNPFVYRTRESSLLEFIDAWRRVGDLVFFFPYIWAGLRDPGMFVGGGRTV
jgi:hypothetical protein